MGWNKTILNKSLSPKFVALHFIYICVCVNPFRTGSHRIMDASNITDNYNKNHHCVHQQFITIESRHNLSVFIQLNNNNNNFTPEI